VDVLRMPTPAERPVYEFGPYRLEPGERLLSRNGRVQALPPKAFDLLVYLVEHQGRLVEKTTLMSALWPDAFVEEGNLAFHISALRKLIDDGRDGDSMIQTVPTKGYRFVEPVMKTATARVAVSREPGAVMSQAEHGRAPSLSRTRTAGLALLAIAGLVAVVMWERMPTKARGNASPPMRVVPLTTLPGYEKAATISPDGRSVAFNWDGGNPDEVGHIYVKRIGSSDIRQISTGPAGDGMPAWSPDGQQIAFLRHRSDGGRIYISSLADGSNRMLSEFPAAMGGAGIDWSPDGHYVAVLRAQDAVDGRRDGIFLVPVNSGASRQLTWPAASETQSVPSFSPDGRSIAFVSCIGNECELFVLSLTAELRPVARPRRLTWQAAWDITRIAWSRDGGFVIYDVYETPSISGLWKVGLGGRPPERIESAGFRAHAPNASRADDRLAFTRSQDNNDIYSAVAGQPSQPWFASSLGDDSPHFSADGSRVVFSSSASGTTQEIWIAAADGSSARQLTHGPGRWQGSPRFSPDGRRVAFDSCCGEGHVHLWTIDADGGPPQQVTSRAGDQNIPIWSPDARYLYFTEDSGNGRDVWRVPAAGGPQERVTTVGTGLAAGLSAYGLSILYQARDGNVPLMSMPVSGGASRQVLPCVQFGAFAAVAANIYYVPCTDSVHDAVVHVLNEHTKQDRVFGVFHDGCLCGPSGLAVSPGGRTILYSRRVSTGTDLMLIENFK
jgi:Tol biopolymer transport system component/DNA-binding winged helix-turn-helix (wHTH) protein